MPEFDHIRSTDKEKDERNQPKGARQKETRSSKPQELLHATQLQHYSSPASSTGSSQPGNMKAVNCIAQGETLPG